MIVGRPGASAAGSRSSPTAAIPRRRWRRASGSSSRPIGPGPQAPTARLTITGAKSHGDGVVAQAAKWRPQWAEALTGRVLVPRSCFPAAGPNEFYRVDLIGLTSSTDRATAFRHRVVDPIDTGPHCVLVRGAPRWRGGCRGTPDPSVGAYVDSVSPGRAAHRRRLGPGLLTTVGHRQHAEPFRCDAIPDIITLFPELSRHRCARASRGRAFEGGQVEVHLGRCGTSLTTPTGGSTTGPMAAGQDGAVRRAAAAGAGRGGARRGSSGPADPVHAGRRTAGPRPRARLGARARRDAAVRSLRGRDQRSSTATSTSN